MARNTITCDSCGKSMSDLGMKVFLSKTFRHEDYDKHADLCTKCGDALVKAIKPTARRRNAK